MGKLAEVGPSIAKWLGSYTNEQKLKKSGERHKKRPQGSTQQLNTCAVPAAQKTKIKTRWDYLCLASCTYKYTRSPLVLCHQGETRKRRGQHSNSTHDCSSNLNTNMLSLVLRLCVAGGTPWSCHTSS